MKTTLQQLQLNATPSCYALEPVRHHHPDQQLGQGTEDSQRLDQELLELENLLSCVEAIGRAAEVTRWLKRSSSSSSLVHA